LNFQGLAGEIKSFYVPIFLFSAAESTENFNIVLSALDAAGISSFITLLNGQATLVNDDGPTISVQNLSISEGQSGTKVANFAITRYGLPGTPVSVTVNATEVTAMNGTMLSAQVGLLRESRSSTTTLDQVEVEVPVPIQPTIDLCLSSQVTNQRFSTPPTLRSTAISTDSCHPSRLIPKPSPMTDLAIQVNTVRL